MKKGKGFLCCFLTVITLFTVSNMGLIAQPAASFLKGKIGFTAFRDAVQAAYQSDGFFLKNQFINLNGLFSKAVGHRMINQVTVLENGMLTNDGMPWRSMDAVANTLDGFNAALAGMNIPFMYVQAPYKLDMANELLPTGVENRANDNADWLLELLREREVPFLDLRQTLTKTAEDVERNFYVTDHHWNPTGAFTGYQMIAQRIQIMLGDSTDIGAYLDRSSWTEHVLEDSFLGSHGKRVGVYVAGIDDLTYLTPRFDTQMSCYVPKYDALYEGDFADALIRQERIDQAKDYFNVNPYSLYIGGDYPLVIHRNERAPVQRKLLLIKDSFMLPVQAFLSTVYQQIEVIDPRHFMDCSLMEYIMTAQPDAVVMMINPSEFHNAAGFDYGYEAL